MNGHHVVTIFMSSLNSMMSVYVLCQGTQSPKRIPIPPSCICQAQKKSPAPAVTTTTRTRHTGERPVPCPSSTLHHHYSTPHVHYIIPTRRDFTGPISAPENKKNPLVKSPPQSRSKSRTAWPSNSLQFSGILLCMFYSLFMHDELFILNIHTHLFMQMYFSQTCRSQCCVHYVSHMQTPWDMCICEYHIPMHICLCIYTHIKAIIKTPALSTPPPLIHMSGRSNCFLAAVCLQDIEKAIHALYVNNRTEPIGSIERV